MQAKLKSLSGIDIRDLANYRPTRSDWRVLLTAEIGRSNFDGTDMFELAVCSVDWIGQQVALHGLYVPRFEIVMEAWDYDQVLKRVEKFIALGTGTTWLEVCNKLIPWFQWEYSNEHEALIGRLLSQQENPAPAPSEPSRPKKRGLKPFFWRG